MIARLILTAGLIAFPSVAALAEDAAREPYEMVRQLRALQDETTHDTTVSPAALRQLGAQIADQLIAANSDAWNDPKNVRAAVIYTLSGGEPRVLRALFGVRALPGVEEGLLNGALAYSEGRDADAAELLAHADVRTLEPSLGAHVALVKSALIGVKDVKRSMALLEEARLLAPGTLVEDAALRRQTFYAAAAKNTDAFIELAAIYLRRFPQSSFVRQFREQFATEVSSEAYAQVPDGLTKLEAMLAAVDPVNRRQAYLAIASQAVVRGRVALGRLAARNAVALTTQGGTERARATVYEGAMLVVGEEPEAAVSSLKAIDSSLLDADDSALIDAALAVAVQMQRPVDAAALPQAGAPAATAGQQQPSLAGVVAQARAAIAQADTLLNEVSR